MTFEIVNHRIISYSFQVKILNRCRLRYVSMHLKILELLLSSYYLRLTLANIIHRARIWHAYQRLTKTCRPNLFWTMNISRGLKLVGSLSKIVAVLLTHHATNWLNPITCKTNFTIKRFPKFLLGCFEIIGYSETAVQQIMECK